MHTNCSEADYNFNDGHARPGNLLVTYYIYGDDTFLLCLKAHNTKMYDRWVLPACIHCTDQSTYWSYMG